MAQKKSLTKLFSLVLSDRHFIGPIAIYTSVVGILSFAVPISVQSLVNSIGFSLLGQPIVILTIILFGVLIVSGIFNALLTHLMDIFHRRIFSRITSEVATIIYNANPTTFREKNGVEMINRFFDIFTIQKCVSVLLIDGITIVLQTVVGLSLIATYHIIFIPVSLFIFLSVLLIVLVFIKKGTKTAIEESKAKYKVVSWLEESVRIYTANQKNNWKDLFLGKTEYLIKDYTYKRATHFNVLFIQMIFLWSLYAFSSALLLGLGGWLVINGKITLGQLVAAEIILSSILYALSKSGKHIELYYDLVAALDKIYEIYELPIKESPPGQKAVESIKSIHFSNITYSNNETQLKLNFTLKCGENITLQSLQGSCRELFIDILLNHISPEKGIIFVNDTSMADISIKDYWSQIYTLRHPFVFEGTLRENLIQYRTDISDRQILDVLEILELRELVEGLPNRLNTTLSPSGYPLWPNQVIRMDLARGILSRPSLLIITESINLIGGDRQQKILNYLTQPVHPWSVVYFTNQIENLQGFQKHMTLDWNGIHDR